MGRPRTDIGTYGTIKITPVSSGGFQAHARFRMRNGRLKPVTRRGESRTKAEKALKKALARLATDAGGKTINGDSPMSKVMDLWLADLEKKVQAGKRAHKTLYEYRGVVKNYLRPALGDLTCREAENAGLCDEVLKDIQEKAAKVTGRGKTGTAAVLRSRTVLSGICAVAVRHGAMDNNPIKSVEKIDHDDNEIRVLEPEDRADFMAKFRAHILEKVDKPGNRLGPRARAWTDLPDIAEGCLSTGGRPGEVLATVGAEVDVQKCIVGLTHHAVRVEGVGMVRKPGRKSRKKKGGGEQLWLRVPSWSVVMWRRRKLESGGGLLFPSWNGELEDPGNVARRIKEVCEAIGYGWVSARILRHTTGTHLGDSDVPDEQIANQLGNTPEVVRAHYRRPKVANQATADALEDLMGG